MGFLSKAIDTRVEQILLNHFGRPIKSDFVVSGYLNIMHLQVSRLAFSAGVNSEGVFIIHEGKVLMALAWENILKCEPNLMTSGVELVIRLSANSQTAPKREYPFNEWFDADINFKKVEDQSRFVQQFYAQKSKLGFTVNSLITHGKWLDYRVALPVSYSKYLEVNAAWNDDEAKHESYLVWGLSQDAQRFLLFLGRSVCSGKVPAGLLKLATEHWMQVEEINSKFTKQRLNVSEELARLIQSTESLGLNSHELGVWSFGLLQTGEDEWVSEIPTKERLVAVHWIESKGSLQQVSVWSDFHDGTFVTILSKLSTPIDGKLAISTSHGLLLLTQKGESDLKDLLELSL